MISRRLLRIKILQVLYAHYNTGGSGIATLEKNLTFSIKKAYDLYHYLLLMTVAIKRFAESRIELALNKKLPTHEDLNPNMRFIENEVILQIEESDSFNKYTTENTLSWAKYPELIKNLYAKLIEAPYYKEYMSCHESGYVEDRQLLIDFFSVELTEHEMFFDILEEQSIFWNDDVEFIVSMVIKTIRDMRPGKFDVFPLYKSDDDRDFALSLLRASVVNYDEYHKMIDSHVVNWDIERVAHVDNLVLQMAINELVVFPTIPIRVTFDEYLELSKCYSTPKSSIFINGLLDKILEELTQDGKIVKTGRGLIEEYSPIVCS